MVIHEGKRSGEQKIALVKLIWGIIVTLVGTTGLISIFTGATALLIAGAILDGIDSIIMTDCGSMISTVFFAITGILICFFWFQSSWWYGLCVGLCCESCLGGFFNYSRRLRRFLAENTGTFTKRIKRSLRRFLENL